MKFVLALLGKLIMLGSRHKLGSVSVTTCLTNCNHKCHHITEVSYGDKPVGKDLSSIISTIFYLETGE